MISGAPACALYQDRDISNHSADYKAVGMIHSNSHVEKRSAQLGDLLSGLGGLLGGTVSGLGS
jgi:hypothetical protein